jgi:outer membrane protein OmpA-like peptidoglycan-associated protein
MVVSKRLLGLVVFGAGLHTTPAVADDLSWRLVCPTYSAGHCQLVYDVPALPRRNTPRLHVALNSAGSGDYVLSIFLDGTTDQARAWAETHDYGASFHQSTRQSYSPRFSFAGCRESCVWMTVIPKDHVADMRSAVQIAISEQDRSVDTGEGVLYPSAGLAPELQRLDCQTAINLPPGLSYGDRVFFDPDSADLKVDGQRTLTFLLRPLKACLMTPVQIDGHIDAAETATTALDVRRAETVKRFLEAEGIQAERLRTVGHGASQPVVLGMTELEQAQNRRVTLRLMDVGESR